MGLFRRSDPPSEERSTIDLSRYAGLWSDLGAYSPVSVSTTTAMTHAASSACIDTLASSVSSLPLDAVRIVGKSRIPVTPAPAIIGEPSPTVEQDVWLYQLMESLLTDGNAFGQVVTYGAAGLPTSIELLDPAVVTNRRIVDGVPTVTVGGVNMKLYPFGDIWHVPGGFVRAGSPFAESPIARARGTIGAAIAARDFGSRFFGDGGHPGGILTNTDAAMTPEQAKGMKAAFLAATKGNREPMVVGAGISYTPIMVDPNDSQFLELMQFCIEEACRFWRVPPSMVYGSTSGQNVTYANASQADLAYLKHSLENRLVRIEKALTRLLPRPQFARFNRNAFLRSDPITRSEVQDRRLRNFTTTVNEVRAQEDEQPFDDPEYDEPGIPDAESEAEEPADDGTDAGTPPPEATPDA
jgi:HK97 family phage portal protein